MNAMTTVFVATLLTFSVSAFGAAKIDSKAPNFTLTDTNNQTISLSDYQGKYVILEWTNHDCPYVKKHYNSGNMQALQKKYTENNVIWLSIISSAPGKQGYVSGAKANELTKDRNASPTAVLMDPDGDVGKQYGARTTPHMYIINPEGDLKYMGGIDSIKSADVADIPKAINYVEKAMAELKAGKPVENKLTPPYGCSVKYKG